MNERQKLEGGQGALSGRLWVVPDGFGYLADRVRKPHGLTSPCRNSAARFLKLAHSTKIAATAFQVTRTALAIQHGPTVVFQLGRHADRLSLHLGHSGEDDGRDAHDLDVRIYRDERRFRICVRPR